jgi:hypothetical protein
MAPRILNLGTIRRCVCVCGQFHAPPTLLNVRLNKTLGGPNRQSARCVGEKNLFLPWDSNPGAKDLICVLSGYKYPKTVSRIKQKQEPQYAARVLL